MEGGEKSKLDKWLTPATIIGVAGLLLVVITSQLNGISDRIASIETREGNIGARIEAVDSSINIRSNAIESRLGDTNARIDRVLEGQAASATAAAHMQIELSYVRGRLDQIAERLEIAEAPMIEPTLLAGTSRDQMIESLRRSGFVVYRADDLADATELVIGSGAIFGDMFVMTGDDALMSRLQEAGIMPLMPNDPRNN